MSRTSSQLFVDARAAIDRHISHLAKQLVTGEYHDLEIECGGEIFLVHRFIVCRKSKFFEKACENNWKEALSRKISIMDESPREMQLLLIFLYCSNQEDLFDAIGACGSASIYATGPKSSMRNATHDSDHRSVYYGALLMFNAKLFALADKFDVPLLRRMAATAFRLNFRHMTTDMGSELSLCYLAVVYNSTPGCIRDLRDVVKTNLTFAEIRTWVDSADFKRLVINNESFAVDMMDMMAADVLAIRDDWDCLSHRRRLNDGSGSGDGGLGDDSDMET